MSAVQVFWKQCGKRRNCSLFSQCFQPMWTTSCHFYQIWNCRLQTLSDSKSLKCVIWRDKSLPHHPVFQWPPSKKTFWKHCGISRKFWKPTFSPFPTLFSTLSKKRNLHFNPLPYMQILAANKNIMSNIWTNGDTIIWLSRKHCG